jgi:hypothetical protein
MKCEDLFSVLLLAVICVEDEERGIKKLKAQINLKFISFKIDLVRQQKIIQFE